MRAGTCLAAILALVVAACAAPSDRSSTPPGPDAIGAEAQLLGWLASVEAAHQAADRASAGAPEVAERALRAALAHTPPASAPAADVRRVRQDFWFRVAQLQLQQSRPEQARLAAQSGLALGRSQDLFTANLLVAQGHALAALGREQDASAAYLDALRINQRLLRLALAQDAGVDLP